MSIETTMDLSVLNSVHCVALFVVVAAAMVCHLLWQKITNKKCQCEVGAYVIFGLLIYSILKCISRDVPTNPCFFRLTTALQPAFF